MDPGASLDQSLRSDGADCLPGVSVCSENTLNFICEFKPGRTSSNVDFLFNVDCEPVSVVLPAQCSVYQLRLRICMQVGCTNHRSEVLKTWFILYKHCFFLQLQCLLQRRDNSPIIQLQTTLSESKRLPRHRTWMVSSELWALLTDSRQKPCFKLFAA